MILFNIYHQVWCWEKVNNLQKIRCRRNKIFVDILFLVFSKSGIKYLWQGEASICKVLVPIKIVLVKNNNLLLSKFELHRYQQMNGFLYWRSFYWKFFSAYISHELIVRLIPTWNRYDLLKVNQIWSSNQQLFSSNFVGLK